MDFKKQINYSGKIKGLQIVNGKFVDADGEVINLVEVLANVYGDMSFDLSTTAKSEEVIDTEPDEEATVDEEGNVVYE